VDLYGPPLETVSLTQGRHATDVDSGHSRAAEIDRYAPGRAMVQRANDYIPARCAHVEDTTKSMGTNIIARPWDRRSPFSVSREGPIERQIELALRPGEFIHDRVCFSFVSGLEEVAARIGKVATREPVRGAALGEAFLAGCRAKADAINDSSAVRSVAHGTAPTGFGSRYYPAGSVHARLRQIPFFMLAAPL
jgi:hypothetical protein